MKKLFIGLLLYFGLTLPTLAQKFEKDYKAIESKVIEWRREIHQNPELSNREFKTAEKIAEHLTALGIEVQTGVAHTGVVGILRGKKPGKVVALRADIDALPVLERNNLPFKSTVTADFKGEQVPVMHACGHDTHTAILMGVAEILSKHTDKIKGTVKFIFQPAEEGPPPGEEGGALLMVKEGVLKNPDVDAIFGLHINSQTPVGVIRYKSGGTMAAAQKFTIKVKGKQSHGARPWSGVDPILISAKIIDGLQTIISREAELTNEAAVITVGKITSGVRFNIIPEDAEMIGTIRTLDYDMKSFINKRMEEMVPAIAKAYGGDATIEIVDATEITYNDPDLVTQMLPTLNRVAGEHNVQTQKAVTGAEDFSYFQKEVPGFFFFLGGMTPGNTASFPHHTPDFIIDDSGLLLGVKALTEISIDYLNKQ
ncbi:amidohydrolase [Zobellia galactanivorans]|uniref:Carboxypeptidase, family M20 n=1 Tax=Zobellia galactanivorans (strain DSM 12802 / CCUG 47099 / CIP 106680 / NCIMB 13871 / Dsij) TaxID=63186 RepID=G0L6V9_ZOBGA|nr:amidohydrolase [Zobellia galactanivorans]MBU3025742.1 amidohydrolase [Zobellia galactanivorans]CAZ98682.1 Carboxypeptidase, family M20 [Zobellia galactanivorans]